MGAGKGFYSALKYRGRGRWSVTSKPVTKDLMKSFVCDISVFFSVLPIIRCNNAYILMLYIFKWRVWREGDLIISELVFFHMQLMTELRSRLREESEMSTQKPLLPDRRRVHVPRSQYTHMPAVSGFRAFCALPRDGTIRTTLSLTNKPSFQKGKEMAGCSLICGIERDTFQKFFSLTTFF